MTILVDYVKNLHYNICGDRLMTQFEKFTSMSREELVDWINEYGQFDQSVWMKWFDDNYCKKCESVIVTIKDLYYRDKETKCSYCELMHKCFHFPDMDHIPTNKEIIDLWFDTEVVKNETMD